MARIKATPQDAPEEKGRQRDAWDAFCNSLPEECSFRTSVARLSSYLHPHIMRPESLSAPAFAEDFSAIVEDIRRRHGPGLYRYYVTATFGDGTKKMLSPEIMIGTEAVDESAPPGPDRGTGGDPMASAVEKLSNAAAARADVMRLEAASRLADGGASAAPNPLEQTKQLAEILRALQPPTDPLTMLKNAKELLTPAGGADLLSTVEKVATIVERFSGGAGGSEPRAGSSGWDFAIELVRQAGKVFESAGPNLGAALQLLTQSRASAGPALVPAPAGLSDGAPGALTGAPVSDATAAILQAVNGDPARADRLRIFLELCAIESGGPSDQWPDGWYSLAEFSDHHVGAVMEQMASQTDEVVLSAFRRLAPSWMTQTVSEPWLRGFLAFLRRPVPEDVPGESGGEAKP